MTIAQEVYAVFGVMIMIIRRILLFLDARQHIQAKRE